MHMPLFGKTAKPYLDPARGDVEAAQLRTTATSGDWRAFDAALRATNDPVRREFLVDVVSFNSAELRWVDAWIAEQPESAAARCTWGACAVQYAWRIRSGAEPKYVSSEQWQGFHHWLTL